MASQMTCSMRTGPTERTWRKPMRARVIVLLSRGLAALAFLGGWLIGGTDDVLRAADSGGSADPVVVVVGGSTCCCGVGSGPTATVAVRPTKTFCGIRATATATDTPGRVDTETPEILRTVDPT